LILKALRSNLELIVVASREEVDIEGASIESRVDRRRIVKKLTLKTLRSIYGRIEEDGSSSL